VVDSDCMAGAADLISYKRWQVCLQLINNDRSLAGAVAGLFVGCFTLLGFAARLVGPAQRAPADNINNHRDNRPTAVTQITYSDACV